MCQTNAMLPKDASHSASQGIRDGVFTTENFDADRKSDTIFNSHVNSASFESDLWTDLIGQQCGHKQK